LCACVCVCVRVCVHKERDAEHTRALHGAEQRMREYAQAHAVSNEQHQAQVAQLQRALEVGVGGWVGVWVGGVCVCVWVGG
jgi:hypothetical protein